MAKLAIDQASNGANPRGVVVTMMAIRLRQGLIAADTANGVLDDNTPFGEGGVISHILWRTLLATRFTTGCCAVAEFADTYIGQITNPTHALRQTTHQPRLSQQRQVGGRPSHAR